MLLVSVLQSPCQPYSHLLLGNIQLGLHSVYQVVHLFIHPSLFPCGIKKINRDSVLFGRQQMGEKEKCCPSLLGYHKGGWPCARIYKRKEEWTSQKGLRGQGSSYILMIHLLADRVCHSVQQHLFLFLLQVLCNSKT